MTIPHGSGLWGPASAGGMSVAACIVCAEPVRSQRWLCGGCAGLQRRGNFEQQLQRTSRRDRARRYRLERLIALQSALPPEARQ